MKKIQTEKWLPYRGISLRGSHMLCLQFTRAIRKNASLMLFAALQLLLLIKWRQIEFGKSILYNKVTVPADRNILEIGKSGNLL